MFPRRHRLLLVVVWAMVPVVATAGFVAGIPVETTGIAALAMLLPATLALLARSRLLASCLVTVALVMAAASDMLMAYLGVITFSDGAAAAHLAFPVAIVAISLYRDWRPLALGLMLTAGYYFAVGLGPDGAGATWAAIHSGFALLTAQVAAVAWREPLPRDRAVDADQFQRAFEAAPIGMAMLRPSGEFIEVNEALARMLEVDAGQLPGTSVRSVVHGEDLTDLGTAWETMGNDDQHTAVAWVRCLTAGGRSIWGRLSLSMVPWSPHRPAMVVLQVEDVTRARIEQRRLEDLLRGKDEFVATIGNEMRKPLTSLIDLARQEGSDLRQIEGQAREVASIVDDLVTSARAGSGATTVVALPVDADVLCRDVVSSVPGAERVRVDVEGEGLTIWADPALTRQILFNLVANAVRFGGPRVSVRARRSGPDVAITIQDDGPGIPEVERERMFSADLRHGPPATRPATVGLSLTVGRHLARAMEGEITYRRTQEGENSFELRLPAQPVGRLYETADELDIPA